MKKRQKGFSQIELLIVVAIILIIAAIAIPNLMRSKMAANESSAASMIRTIYTSAVTYSTTYGNGYPDDLPTLAPPGSAVTTGITCANAGLIDSTLGSGTKSGYTFKLVGDASLAVPAGGGCKGSVNFTAGAVPLAKSTGTRSFCVGNDGVIMQDSAGVDDTANTGTCKVLVPLDTK